MSREMTDPNIVQYASNGFRYYLAQGDTPERALAKSIGNALAKLWRRKPIDMTNPRNAARYGDQYEALVRLVSEKKI